MQLSGSVSVRLNLIACDRVHSPQIALWDAVVEWAQTDCKVQGREANAENLRCVFCDLRDCRCID